MQKVKEIQDKSKMQEEQSHAIETKRSSALSIASIVLAGRVNDTKVDDTINEVEE